MKKIRINFTDFWPEFDKTDNYFCYLLQKKYQIELSDTPDFLFYSVFGQEHQKYNCCKIFYTGENIRPNFFECNFAITFDYIASDNHYRLPLYALYLYKSPNALVKNNWDIDRIIQSKTKFCNFVFSNINAEERTRFFYKLSQYKQVDAGGRYLNNIGRFIGNSIQDKLNFIEDYKFTIAFENSSYPGYITEKIIHPMQVGSLPIYWGNELAFLDFNPKSFINYYDYGTEDELVQRIIEIDQKEELYRSYLEQPYFYNNLDNEYIHEENILNWFEKILG